MAHRPGLAPDYDTLINTNREKKKARKHKDKASKSRERGKSFYGAVGSMLVNPAYSASR